MALAVMWWPYLIFALAGRFVMFLCWKGSGAGRGVWGTPWLAVFHICDGGFVSLRFCAGLGGRVERDEIEVMWDSMETSYQA